MGKPEDLSAVPPVDRATLLAKLARSCRDEPARVAGRHEALRMRRHDRVPAGAARRRAAGRRGAGRRRAPRLPRLKVPVVARGAGTGLSGGALPNAQGVTLALSKMKRILAIDPLARIARVQPGVRNLAISEAAAPLGLYYAPDPSSQIACSIGGNVAENSGGVHCLKYGLTVHNVLKRARRHDRGRDPRTRRRGARCRRLRPAGADDRAPRACWAVVTEITVKLLPKPQLARSCSPRSTRREGRRARSRTSSPPASSPAGLEMMDKLATQAVEQFVHAGYPLDAEAILLCESDGTPEEVAAEIERMEAVLRASGATQIRRLEGRGRAAALLVRPQGGVSGVGRMIARLLLHGRHDSRSASLAEVLAASRSSPRNSGCAAQRLPRRRRQPAPADPVRREHRRAGWSTREVRLAILQLCVEAGGTITGEHGVGVEKIGEMCVQFTPDELATFHAVKRAFDPSTAC
jgi:glycolate oxidase